MSQFMRRSRVAAALLAGAMALSACSSTGGDNEGSESNIDRKSLYTTGFVGQTDAGDPKRGGILTVAEYGEARTLNPAAGYANGAVGGSALAAVYDTLIRYDYETGTWQPKAAESLTTDDQITWTLKLREGVTFSDGTPYNAEAVVASLKFYLANYGYQSTTMLANGVTMKALDDLTVEFTSKAGPWSTFPAMLAGGPGMIMAPTAYRDPANFKPIGAGPFTFDSYKPTEELVLTANGDYWDGRPYLDKLRFVWLGADDVKLESLASGEVDSAYIRNNEAVERAVADGVGGFMFVVGAGSQITMNLREGRPAHDVRVRQALQLAFDNEGYAERAWNGAGLPSKSLFPESSPWFTGVEYPEVDRAKAADLLNEAKADGYNGKISYLAAADPTSQLAAVQFEAQAEAVGFDVTIEGSENIADGTKRLYIDHDFDLALSAANIGDPDPYASLFEIYSTMGSTNLSGTAIPEIDELLVDLRAEADDPANGVATMRRIEEILRDEAIAIGLGPSGNFVMWADNIHGIVPTVQELVHYDKAWKSQ